MEKNASARTLASSRLGLVPLSPAPSWFPAPDLASGPPKAFNRAVLIPAIEPGALEWIQPLHRSTARLSTHCKPWASRYAMIAL